MKPKYFTEAFEAIAFAQKKINRKRKRKSTISTMSTFLFKNNYSDYTDENCHAELVAAELLATDAMMTVVSDQSITGFVKVFFLFCESNVLN